jgi:hypothetical protein
MKFTAQKWNLDKEKKLHTSKWIAVYGPKRCSKTEETIRQNVKLCLCLIQWALHHECVWGSECIDVEMIRKDIFYYKMIQVLLKIRKQSTTKMKW